MAAWWNVVGYDYSGGYGYEYDIGNVMECGYILVAGRNVMG